MGSKYLAWTLVLALISFANSDIEKDKEECANQLVGLVTCLPYVGGDAKAPTSDCCSGIKQVIKTSRKCLCVLVKDRNDPSLGLKINATLALGLPTYCNSPTEVSDCTALLQLAPNSTDAKVFEDFANSTKGSNSSLDGTNGNSTSNGLNAEIKSEGGRGKRWLVVEMACLVIFSVVLHTLL